MTLNTLGGLLLNTLFIILISRDINFRSEAAPPTTRSITTTTHYPWKFYNPHYGYEPYWKGGDWIFTEREKEQQESGTIPPYICNDVCPWIYWRVGEVCARSKDWNNFANTGWKAGTDRCTWGYYSAWNCYGNKTLDLSQQFVTFRTYCKFLDAKCKGSTLAVKWQYYFVHMGPCKKKQSDVYRTATLMQEPWHFIYRQSYFIKEWSDRQLTAITTTLKPREG